MCNSAQQFRTRCAALNHVELIYSTEATLADIAKTQKFQCVDYPTRCECTRRECILELDNVGIGSIVTHIRCIDESQIVKERPINS